MESNLNNQTPQLLRAEEVARCIGMSKTSVFRLAKAGKFPKQIRVSGQTTAWLKSEVVAWINDRVKERNEASK
ncbi:helix-turn-helix transcriptional regulator [Francisella philomiragia]|uniref:AlpA family phage regulatory protein n=1 Tax=Francisella philomiragia TaxID=28110 RepID=A0ABS1GE27_9GAMM|nr:AlpA family phage regulatory protein [Francisella philomiragia]MBK2259179.1 AlpA family phage regulatory protein [Francisella philomiragia]MBK2302784.1 AlpA family phage regulatory protein [Francisella philomiragia]